MSAPPPPPPPPPTNPLVTALLTDVYQVTMSYAYFRNGRHTEPAVFELFFRKNPFQGEYTIFAGLDQVLSFVHNFSFSKSDIEYLRNGVPGLAHCSDDFFDWLASVDTGDVKLYAMLDGTVAFPRVPLIVVEAPLAVGQLLETTLLTLVNYPSLLSTNSARMVRAAQQKSVPSRRDPTRKSILFRRDKTASSDDSSAPNSGAAASSAASAASLPSQCYKVPVCIEFGLRRAQGPDGGFSGSKYSVVGGFVGTSNLQAGKLCEGLDVVGTHAHSFVQSYSALDEVRGVTVVPVGDGEPAKGKLAVPLLPIALRYRKELSEAFDEPEYLTSNEGELAAFVSYAGAFPRRFLCLIDTYDTLQSGLLNFVVVAMALAELGYEPAGIRLDSGDLAYLSMECAKVFDAVAAKYQDKADIFRDLSIVVSNDINEAVLHQINKEEHAITSYGIGTNLVTCQSQPALGCVYKLVEISGQPRIKLSQEIEKVLIPGRKVPYRLYGKDGRPILDLMIAAGEDEPERGVRVLCRHPFIARKRAAVIPARVQPLHHLVFDGGDATAVTRNRSLTEARDAAAEELDLIRPDILRYMNPTPYKVSLSCRLFDFLHSLWQSEVPIPEYS